MANSHKLDFILRPATQSDVLTIAALGMQVFMDTYATEGVRDAIAREALESFAPETIAGIIERPDTLFLLAETRGVLFYPRQGYMSAGSPVHRLQAETHQNVLFCKSLSRV